MEFFYRIELYLHCIIIVCGIEIILDVLSLTEVNNDNNHTYLRSKLYPFKVILEHNHLRVLSDNCSMRA
ncbi:hypothetical protein RIR_jg14147.t1 [Rhizophagus irregularis DAOM 181602=DAOM 197198]|nr:hypothetical protein RIR_jg14147.t1 [Rhizophagus irregularis DAOM 181602=DAOM 197198]